MLAHGRARLCLEGGFWTVSGALAGLVNTGGGGGGFRMASHCGFHARPFKEV